MTVVQAKQILKDKDISTPEKKALFIEAFKILSLNHFNIQ